VPRRRAGSAAAAGGPPGPARPAGSFLDLPLRDFLELLAAREPAPGGGAAAAVTAALAAGLAAMAGRFSDARLPAAEDVARQADELRERAAGLADRDAAAYRAVLDAYRLPRGGGGGERREAIAAALHRAAAVPVEIAEISAQVAALAADVAAAGNPNLRGDTMTAAYLAEASARSAEALADINVCLGQLPGDLRRRAAAAVAAARAAAARVSTAPP
jgi:methenyltetrahydrofolate cyclohydrolase